MSRTRSLSMLVALGMAAAVAGCAETKSGSIGYADQAVNYCQGFTDVMERQACLENYVGPQAIGE